MPDITHMDYPHPIDFDDEHLVPATLCTMLSIMPCLNRRNVDSFILVFSLSFQNHRVPFCHGNVAMVKMIMTGRHNIGKCVRKTIAYTLIKWVSKNLCAGWRRYPET